MHFHQQNYSVGKIPKKKQHYLKETTRKVSNWIFEKREEARKKNLL